MFPIFVEKKFLQAFCHCKMMNKEKRIFMKRKAIIQIFFISVFTVFLFTANSVLWAQDAASQDTTSQDVAVQNTSETPKRFEFKYKKGDNYRVLSTMREDVYVNSMLDHHAEIVNRITVQVTDASDDGKSGTHEATFMTSEAATSDITGRTFGYGEEYKSIFERDNLGHYTISDEYFMPVVRDVPVFPDREILPGYEWAAQGHEAHDLRRTFGLQEPYKIPFNASYKYIGQVKDEETGKVYDKFTVSYNMYYKIALNVPDMTYKMLPSETSGFSKQTLYWDSEKGCLDHYNEEFRITIKTTNGVRLRFEGVAEAEVTEFERTATDSNVTAVMEKINDLGIQNVTVTAGEKGLTISIENIQFEPDSDILRPNEKVKIDKIAEILSGYTNDLLITGHTALRGSEKSRKKLSQQRAQSVADYLIQKNVRDKYHIFTQGLGATSPIADNDTEEGRAKNRRVEITIMDK